MNEQTRAIAAHDHYLARIRRAIAHLNNAKRELDDACAEISSIRGLAGVWTQWRTASDRLRTIRDKFELTIARRSRDLAEMNGGGAS